MYKIPKNKVLIFWNVYQELPNKQDKLEGYLFHSNLKWENGLSRETPEV